jgi:hypothetical protein
MLEVPRRVAPGRQISPPQNVKDAPPRLPRDAKKQKFPAHPPDLLQGCKGSLQVFENLTGQHKVELSVSKGKGINGTLKKPPARIPYLGQRDLLWVDVEAVIGKI